MWRFNFLQLRPANDNAAPRELDGRDRVMLALDGLRWVSVRRADSGPVRLTLARPAAMRRSIRRPHEAS